MWHIHLINRATDKMFALHIKFTQWNSLYPFCSCWRNEKMKMKTTNLMKWLTTTFRPTRPTIWSVCCINRCCRHIFEYIRLWWWWWWWLATIVQLESSLVVYPIPDRIVHGIWERLVFISSSCFLAW